MDISNNIVARANADLQRALSAAAKARETLAKFEAEVADLEAFLRTLERYVGLSEPGTSPRTDAEHSENTGRTAPKPGSRAHELVNSAIEAIRAAGKPLMIGDLLEHVLHAGFTLGGKDLKSNLAGYLSRDPRVHSLGRSVGWDLVEKEEAASEPASHVAASSENTGGTNDRTTLVSDDFSALLGD